MATSQTFHTSDTDGTRNIENVFGKSAIVSETSGKWRMTGAVARMACGFTGFFQTGRKERDLTGSDSSFSGLLPTSAGWEENSGPYFLPQTAIDSWRASVSVSDIRTSCVLCRGESRAKRPPFPSSMRPNRLVRPETLLVLIRRHHFMHQSEPSLYQLACP